MGNMTVLEVGDLVEIMSGPARGKRAIVYEVYWITSDPGVSIVSEAGDDLGGWSWEEWCERGWLKLIVKTECRYQFKNVSQLAIDIRKGYFKQFFMNVKSPHNYDLDSDGTVINGPKTYHFLGRMMEKGDHAFFPWTDGEGTQFDIFMSPFQTFGEFPNIQGGLNSGGFLYVGIIRRGAWAFSVKSGEKHPNYVAEKLLLEKSGDNPTARGLAQLINAVIGDFMGI